MASQALAGLGEQSEPVQLNNLLVVAARLIKQSGLDAVRPLFASVAGFADLFVNGLDVGVRAIRSLVPDHPILAWNAMMLSAEEGTLTNEEVQEVRQRLSTAPEPSVYDECLLLKPKVDYLTEPEEGQIYFGLLQHRLVAAHGDAEATGGVYADYLRWHALRWLHARGGEQGDVLGELIDLWPADSILQREWAARLSLENPSDPRIAEAQALILRLEPDSGDQSLPASPAPAARSGHKDRAVPERQALRSLGSSEAKASRPRATSSP